MTQHNYDQLRLAMVESQLRTTGVNDPRVIEAMAAVPRERFVPESRGFLAYADRAVRIGEQRAMPAPMVIGRLLTELRPLRTDLALVVGSGSGYAAAVLATMVAHVVALDDDPALAKNATLPVNVEIAIGAMAAGWADGAPYDLILFDGAVEQVPQPIIDQLAPEGRLAVPLAQRGIARLSIGRRSAQAFGLTSFADADVPVLPGFAAPAGFRF